MCRGGCSFSLRCSVLECACGSGLLFSGALGLSLRGSPSSCKGDRPLAPRQGAGQVRGLLEGRSRGSPVGSTEHISRVQIWERFEEPEVRTSPYCQKREISLIAQVKGILFVQ